MKQTEIVQTIVTLEQSPYLFNYFLAKVLNHLEMVLYQINLIRSFPIKPALRGTGTSRYKSR